MNGETAPQPVPRPLEPVRATGDERLDALARLLAIVDRLRAPDGCPWDREQTVASLAPSLVEEAFEAVESIDLGLDAETAAELGDLLMVIALIARVASEERRFDLATVARAVAEKLVRRHPHVFGDVQVDSSAHAIANWEKIKAAERVSERKDSSALAGVPTALPALQRASRIAAKAISAGFRWQDARGALAKLGEADGELAELVEPDSAGSAPGAADRARLEEELGDVLLSAAFLGHYLELDPERAARSALRRFEARFRAMETKVGERLRSAPLEELLAAWRDAKAATDERRESPRGDR